GGHAVAVLHHVAHLGAVGQPADGAVVAGGEDGPVEDQHRAHVLAVAGGAAGDHRGDLHEVGVPIAAGHARLRVTPDLPWVGPLGKLPTIQAAGPGPAALPSLWRTRGEAEMRRVPVL